MAKTKATKKKPRNRAAQEATLINVRAAKKRNQSLEARVAHLERQLAEVSRAITALESIIGLLAD